MRHSASTGRNGLPGHITNHPRGQEVLATHQLRSLDHSFMYSISPRDLYFMSTSLLTATANSKTLHLPISEYFVLKERCNDPQTFGTTDRRGG